MDPQQLVTPPAPQDEPSWYSAFAYEDGQINIQDDIRGVTLQTITVPAGSDRDGVDAALVTAGWERICPWEVDESLSCLVVPSRGES